MDFADKIMDYFRICIFSDGSIFPAGIRAVISHTFS